MKALTFSRFGDADVLEYIDVPRPKIKDHEVLIKLKAIGLNYADIYRRRGNYVLVGQPPYISGYEGAGIIIESRSPKYKVGERVAIADVPLANAEFISAPESHIIPLPEIIDFSLAASILLQGLTAQYLAQDSHAVQSGEIVLVHAASGGVGQILTQICKMKGATVIGLTRNKDKTNIISETGADHVVLLDDNWKSKVMEITKGKGVDVVYDSVGITLKDDFDITKERGQVVFYGMSGGDPEPIDPKFLMFKSQTLTAADLWNYLTSETERKKRSKELFEWISKGHVQIKDPVIFKLSEGNAAHEFLEKGKSTGKVLLIPDSEYDEIIKTKLS